MVRPYLLAYLHASPEGDVILDVLGFVVLGAGIVPGCVGIVLAVYTHGVIAGFALPASSSVGLRLDQVLALDRVRREVLVAFHLDGAIGLGEHGAVPNCFRHASNYHPELMTSR